MKYLAIQLRIGELVKSNPIVIPCEIAPPFYEVPIFRNVKWGSFVSNDDFDTPIKQATVKFERTDKYYDKDECRIWIYEIIL